MKKYSTVNFFPQEVGLQAKLLYNRGKNRKKKPGQEEISAGIDSGVTSTTIKG